MDFKNWNKFELAYLCCSCKEHYSVEDILTNSDGDDYCKTCYVD